MPELPDPRSVSAESLNLWRLLAVRSVVDFEMSQADAAAQYGVSSNTMSQWVSLYREQGEAGLAVQPKAVPRARAEFCQASTKKRCVSS
jgi:transposase-like protein